MDSKVSNNSVTGQFKENLSSQLNNSFDFRRLIGNILSKWYWFALSLAIFIAAGWTYLRYATPEYMVVSTLLLETKSDLQSTVLDKFSAGDESIDKTLYNEIFVLQSKDLISEVVGNINLNIHYWVKGNIKENELYEATPIHLEFDSLGYTGDGTTILVEQTGEGQFVITEGEKKTKVLYDLWIRRPYGTFKITYFAGVDANKGYLKNPVQVRMETVAQASAFFRSNYNVKQADGRTSMLELSTTETLPKRGIDFLTETIRVYHRNEKEGINYFAKKTREFIEDRQAKLVENLKNVDMRVEDIRQGAGGVDATQSPKPDGRESFCGSENK